MTARKRIRPGKQMPKQVAGFPPAVGFIDRLSQLPFEQQVDRVLNALEGTLKRSVILGQFEKMRGRVPYIPATVIPSPFGAIEIPAIEVPGLVFPEIDDRRREALKAAIAIDLSGLVALIPLLGDALADVIEDTYGNRIREILTPEEVAAYSRYDRVGPSTVAMLRALGGV